MAQHQPKSFPNLKDIEGLSENQLSQHRDILYTAYVKKLNEIEEKQRTVDLASSNQTFSDLRALKSDETFAYNAVVLHELYFENLGGAKGSKPKGKLSDMIASEFGSFERFTDFFKACGMSARGWTILALSAYDGKLHVYNLDAHNSNVPIHAIPILVMDVYEHAYTIDYGVKRPPYIEAFMKNINWSVCMNRLEKIDINTIMKTAAS